MAGMSIPSGFGTGSFGGASTAGFTGGQQNPNTTAAVTNYAGKLEAYDPSRMASTATALEQPHQPDPYAIAGFTNGIPNWQANWLQNGGQGELKAPEASTGEVQSGPGSAASTFVPPTPMKPIPPPTTKKTTTNVGATSSTAGKSGTTTAAATPQYTMIPFNAAGGYNQPGLQQPMAVSDQWNPSTGSSNQIASTAPGSPLNAPQVMGGGIYMDGKGGYFAKDPSGKMVPMTGQQLQIAKGVAQSFGYR